jgi:hypothetical protein
MATPEYRPRLWTDADDAPITEGEQRRKRIAELLRASDLARRGRRLDDPALLKQIEAELTALMDAELVSIRQTEPVP